MRKQLKELFKRKDTVYVFDIDGVLSAFEYGTYRHNLCGEKEWAEMTKYAEVYSTARPLKIFQKFIRKNIDRCYVCSWETNKNFKKQKYDFVYNNYGIKPNHVFFVDNNEDKLLILEKIHSVYYPHLPKRSICMVDDSTTVLNHIYDNSNYTTIHISSFIN